MLIPELIHAAINKPSGITSAQVLRDLQSKFTPSSFFAPWIEAQRAHLKQAWRRPNSKAHQKRSKLSNLQVKLGHGGTLDPSATGVLIVGIGQGTKELSKFLDGTKTYEATVTFGAATDTYDGVGKVVGRRKWEHVTKESFEKALRRFHGDLMQKPPIFSALRMDGKRLYEYAREGKDPPRPIEARPVRVDELELVEWMEGGTHGYVIPQEEVAQEEKEAAMKLIDKETACTPEDFDSETFDNSTNSPGAKRKHVVDDAEKAYSEEAPSPKRTKTVNRDEASEATPTPESTTETAQTSSDPPAARIRMTVSSGFYVRSLCHDLGMALHSLAFMSSLVRTRQSIFELNKNVLEWDELSKGEASWASHVEKMLDDWNEQHEKG